MKYEATNGLMEDHNRQQQPNVCCCLPNQIIVNPNRAQNRNVKSVLELPIPLGDDPPITNSAASSGSHLLTGMMVSNRMLAQS